VLLLNNTVLFKYFDERVAAGAGINQQAETFGYFASNYTITS
jgi:hypothetical protein